MVYLVKDNVLCLDNDALLVYTALRSMYHKSNNIMYISINQICYQLCGNINYTRAFKDNVISGFDKLCDEFITIKDRISKTEFIVDLSGLFFEGEYFVEIDLEYIRKVCNCPSRVDKCSLLKYFLTMVSTFNHSIFTYKGAFEEKTGFVGFMPISYIAKETGISEQTAMSYNTILEDNKIVYIYRHNGYYKDKNGNIKTVNNHYGLYENKKDIIRFGKCYDKYVKE